MYIKEFPDLKWLQRVAKSNFEDRRGIHNTRLHHHGWPSVVLNTRSDSTERNAIKGPFSLFLNLSGESMVKVAGRSIKVGTETFVLSNKGQYYDLIIPDSATTYNVHFGDHLYNEVLQDLKFSTDTKLSRPHDLAAVTDEFLVKSSYQDKTFKHRLKQVQKFYNDQGSPNANDEELVLADLLSYLVTKSQHDLQGLTRITSSKRTTRKELMRRLLLSIDYIHDHFCDPLSLDELSRISSLSKFHYLRSFKEAFECTPQAYWRSLRLQKAEELLGSSNYSVQEVALAVGFVEPNSFIKFFSSQRKISPGKYRQKISNPG